MKVTRPGTGAQVGDYRILRSLGSGGMGQVFAAQRPGDPELVALKQVAVIDPTALYRFKQEFRSLADLPHPNLVGLGELVVLPGDLAFFTMELVEGETLARWVRHAAPAGTVPNLHRLCHAMRQLAAGVSHLHRAARVHRDLKPSNVLVTAEGRVVILDFGLVYELSPDNARITATGQAVGTPAYMAPEQGRRGHIGPAIDLYAIGVILFECLTGCMPFVGSATGVLVDKQHEPAPDPRELAEGIPDWLAQLCRSLLDIEPSRRPSADEIVALLDVKVEAAPASAANDSAEGPRLVGRAAQLELMTRAHEEVAGRGATVVRLSGPLGRGKSALVDAFLRSLQDGETVVLRGRCHPRESVPYKGLDSLVDALALHLRALPPVDAAALQPRHVRELCELFPVLRGIWRESRRLIVEREPAVRRRLGAAALREVLARIADAQALVLVIDDFHWGDLDGLDVIEELLAPPAAPAMLMVLAHEPGDTPVLAQLGRSPQLAGARTLELPLAPLHRDAARELARTLIDPRRVDDLEAAVVTLVEDSGGEPLALVRGATAGLATVGSVVADGEALRRIRSLAADARELLEIATVAGAPLPNSLARELLGCDLASFEVAACDLVMAGLLGAVALESRGFVKLAQPRVGELVRVELEAGHGRGLHLRLAGLLAAQGADPERVAEHFEGGGDRERARVHMTEAARRAAEALAFVRAERLYRRALELLPSSPEANHRSQPSPRSHRSERRELQLALADQLVHLARSPEAEALYGEAEEPRGPRDHHDQASKLRLLAAEQYGSAASQSALPKLRARLREHDEHLPHSALGAAARGVLNRLHLRWLLSRGFELRRPDQLAAEALERFDLVHAANLASSRGALGLGRALRPRALALALTAGDPLRLVVALRSEAGVSRLTGRLAAAAKRVAEAKRVAAASEDALVSAHAHAAELQQRCMQLDCAAAEASYHAVEDCVERSEGARVVAVQLLDARAQLLGEVGAHRRLRRVLPEWLRIQRESKLERHAALTALASARAWLDLGQRPRARRMLDLAAELGARVEDVVLDYALERAQLRLQLSARASEPAGLAELLERAEAAEHTLRRRGHAWLTLPRVQLRALRLRIQLHRALLLDEPGLGPSARELARLRRHRIPALELESLALAAGQASLVEPGDQESSWRELLAAAQLRRTEALAAAARWRLAQLHVDDALNLEARAEGYFLEQDILEPDDFVDRIAPARGSLSAPGMLD